jgi:hypothetical protein
MIFLTVGDSGCRVGVGREVVKFCESIVRALWHGYSSKADGVIYRASVDYY